MKLSSIIAALTLTGMAFAGPTGLLDEFALPNPNAESPSGGIWAPDNDVASQGTSKVLINSPEGQYPAGMALTSTSTPACPMPDVSGESPCWWGWNTEDAYTANGLTSLLEVTELINPTGWGWASAGWYYIFSYNANATGEGAFDKSTPVSYTTGDALTFSFSYPAGQVLTLALFEKVEEALVNDGTFARPKLKLTGTGSMQELVIPFSDFSVPSWATAAHSVATAAGNLTAISFLREEASASLGATPSTLGGQNELVIGKLCVNGCGAANVAVLDRTEAVSLDFAMNGSALQFRNVKGSVEVEVFNTVGQRMVSKTVTAFDRSVELGNLNKGVYMVRTIDQAGLQMTRKVAF
jgi:hypothetical protein